MSINGITYNSCISNLNKLISGLESTDVKFLFFLASNLDEPKVRTSLKRWFINDQEFFIMYGLDKAHVYVYRKSELTVLVEFADQTKAPKPGSFLSPSASLKNAFNSFQDVTILDPYSGDVNVGNHVDFGIIRQRKKPGENTEKILIKSHYTSYTNLDLVPVTRNEDRCNFVVKDQNFNDYDEFCKTGCESTYGAKLGEIHNVYLNPEDRLVVFHLCKTAFYGLVTGGSATKYMTYRGRKYRVRKGKRGGEYIQLSGNLKKYIKNTKRQAGGAPLTYGGISFMTDTFVQYLSENIIQPVGHLRPYDLISVKVFFDEKNELSPNGNRNIVVIYDFDYSSSNIFYIDTIMLLTACYADTTIKNNPSVILSPEEQASLESAKSIFKMISNTAAVTVQVRS